MHKTEQRDHSDMVDMVEKLGEVIAVPILALAEEEDGELEPVGRS
jgi:hypothetical protein